MAASAMPGRTPHGDPQDCDVVFWSRMTFRRDTWKGCIGLIRIKPGSRAGRRDPLNPLNPLSIRKVESDIGLSRSVGLNPDYRIKRIGIRIIRDKTMILIPGHLIITQLASRANTILRKKYTSSSPSSPTTPTFYRSGRADTSAYQ